MIKFRSIRSKILFWFVSALFIILLGLSLSFYFFMHNFLYTNAEHLIRDKNFAVGGWIDFRRNDMSFQVNEYLHSQESALFIQVSDLNRKVIGKTDNLKSSLPLSAELAKRVYKLDDVVLTTYQSPIYGNMLVANGTGLNDDKILGFVQVAIQEKEITKTLDSVIKWVLISIPILLLLSFVLGKFLTRKILVPFSLVTSSAKEISVSELSNKRLPVINPNDELGKLTRVINDLLNRLNDSVISQKQFVADAAHELRTPLAIIRGEIEVCLRSSNSLDEYEQVLQSNLEEVEKLTSIAENLITLTRLDADNQQLEKGQFDLTELCKSVIFRFSKMLDAKRMVCNLLQSDIIIVNANKPYIEQVLVNLIDNSIKYSPENTSVDISVDLLDKVCVLRVKDHGVGIPQNELPFIFNRFYRVDKSRSGKVVGSGIGLAIVKSIIELHDGTIEVKSVLGSGTEFIIKL